MNVTYIAELREQLGMTQTDLGKILDVTRQTIAAWEKGDRLPSPNQLKDIARALKTTPEVFLESLEDTAEMQLLFRADDPSTLLNAIKVQIAKKIQAYSSIEKEMKEVPALPPSYSLYQYDPEIVEGLALKIRDFLGVEQAPLGDVITLLEERGMKVILQTLSDKISGFSAYTESLGSTIVVNDHFPVERQYFTALHELAHLMCHRQDYAKPSTPPTKSDPREQIANHLAGAALIPKEIVLKELRLYRNEWIPLPLLQDLKARYSVSMRTLLYRASQVGLITKTQLGQQMGHLDKVYGRLKEEPSKEAIVRRTTNRSRLSRLTLQAFRLGEVPLTAVCEILECSAPKVKQLLSQWEEPQP